jgi:hypothetical protein
VRHPGIDEVNGKGRDDTVIAKGDDDTVYSGGGNDYLSGDSIIGGVGTYYDHLYGGLGDGIDGDHGDDL